MAYFSPYIDGTGMHIPLYQEIVDKLVEDMKQIFGDDIYLEADSQDYQQISIFARMIAIILRYWLITTELLRMLLVLA